ncbi:hypothetical protein NLG97_g11204 [Lecanicillium saksenae]|uniref:Uncharacterized protein n=1 Tax=Lecanicillium saksenae TaxID=468837 RepID=A0ACC1QEW8_9HYPO|nr:hypothetical protein NLG97_g11204 [Lecanicillium saksenae]
MCEVSMGETFAEMLGCVFEFPGRREKKKVLVVLKASAQNVVMLATGRASGSIWDGDDGWRLMMDVEEEEKGRDESTRESRIKTKMRMHEAEKVWEAMQEWRKQSRSSHDDKRRLSGDGGVGGGGGGGAGAGISADEKRLSCRAWRDGLGWGWKDYRLGKVVTTVGDDGDDGHGGEDGQTQKKKSVGKVIEDDAGDETRDGIIMTDSSLVSSPDATREGAKTLLRMPLC